MAANNVRSQIMAAIYARLLTILKADDFYSDLGLNAYRFLSEGVDPAKSLPAVDARAGKSEVKNEYGPSIVDFLMRVEFTLILSVDRPDDEEVRKHMLDVYQAIAADETWSGLAISSTPEGDDITSVKLPDTYYGGTIKIGILYRTNRWEL